MMDVDENVNYKTLVLGWKELELGQFLMVPETK